MNNANYHDYDACVALDPASHFFAVKQHLKRSPYEGIGAHSDISRKQNLMSTHRVKHVMDKRRVVVVESPETLRKAAFYEHLIAQPKKDQRAWSCEGLSITDLTPCRKVSLNDQVNTWVEAVDWKLWKPHNASSIYNSSRPFSAAGQPVTSIEVPIKHLPDSKGLLPTLRVERRNLLRQKYTGTLSSDESKRLEEIEQVFVKASAEQLQQKRMSSSYIAHQKSLALIRELSRALERNLADGNHSKEANSKVLQTI